MKPHLLKFIFFLLPVALFAGGASDVPAKETLKFAAVLPGPVNDGGWNTLMHHSLMSLGEQFGAETAYTEQTAPSDHEEIFRSYAEAGFKVIFGHGFEFTPAALKVAKDFPETYFIINSSTISRKDNVGSFLIDDFQCGFAQGAISAIVSKTGVAGYIGGMEIPPIINQAAGFKAGAKFINPDIRVISVLTGSFTDIARAKEAALSLISCGADIISCDANEANHGIYEAALEQGVYVLGSSGDLYVTTPDFRKIVLTSVLEDVQKGHSMIVRDIMKGVFQAKNYLLGFESGAVSIAPLREKKAEITEAQMKQIHQLQEDLQNSALNIKQ